MIDVTQQINSVRRRVGSTVLEAGEARIVTIGQTYDADIDDVWDACTNPDRLPRWFMAVSGDLRVGGRYQLEKNAGGTIEECAPPHRFAATWEYGESVSRIELRLTAEPGGGTRFELVHTLPIDDHWSEFGPGAVGIGWDLTLIGLYMHLDSGKPVDPAEVEQWSASEAGKEFITRSSEGWRDADVAAGTARDDAAAAAARTTAAYTASENDTEPAPG